MICLNGESTWGLVVFTGLHVSQSSSISRPESLKTNNNNSIIQCQVRRYNVASTKLFSDVIISCGKLNSCSVTQSLEIMVNSTIPVLESFGDRYPGLTFTPLPSICSSANRHSSNDVYSVPGAIDGGGGLTDPLFNGS